MVFLGLLHGVNFHPDKGGWCDISLMLVAISRVVYSAMDLKVVDYIVPSGHITFRLYVEHA